MKPTTTIFCISVIIIMFCTYVLVANVGIVNATEEQACFSRYVIMERLYTKYNEIPFVTALDSSGWVIELWVSPNSDSWTLFRTLPNGMSCLIDAGEGINYDPKFPEQLSTIPDL